MPNHQHGPSGAPVRTISSAAQEPSPILFLNTNSLPKDDRPDVQTLYRFAQVVKLYNFNPEIITLQTNDKLRMMEVATPTHSAEIVKGKLVFLASHYDGSDARANPEAVKTWHECTGTWKEAEAVKETLAILERVGRRQVADQLSNALHEYEAERMRVPTPDGGKTMVTPFVKISFDDGEVVLRAEFRMGTNGPAGLTRWFYRGP